MNDRCSSNFDFFFSVIRCGFVGTITNGKVFLNNSSFGGVASFECDEGFNLIGVSLRTCGLDGKWTDSSPECSSKLYCTKLEAPLHGSLIYATEKGQLKTETKEFHTGTLAEVQCDVKYHPNKENLIACQTDGTWDNPLPECIPDEGAIIVPDRLFYRNLHTYLLFGCSPKNAKERSILCERYDSNLTDLTTLATLDNILDVDQKLFDLFQQTLAAKNFQTININNFFEFILYQNQGGEKFEESVEDSFRLTLCFYMTMLDVEPGEDEELLELGKKLRESLTLIVQPVFDKFLQDNEPPTTTSTKRPGGIRAMIASKEREKLR